MRRLFVRSGPEALYVHPVRIEQGADFIGCFFCEKTVRHPVDEKPLLFRKPCTVERILEPHGRLVIGKRKPPQVRACAGFGLCETHEFFRRNVLSLVLLGIGMIFEPVMRDLMVLAPRAEEVASERPDGQP